MTGTERPTAPREGQTLNGTHCTGLEVTPFQELRGGTGYTRERRGPQTSHTWHLAYG